VFHCSSTGQVKPRDIVISNIQNLWGYPGPGGSIVHIDCSPPRQCAVGYVTSARVLEVVPNVSIKIKGDLKGITPATSQWSVLLPIHQADFNGNGIYGPDGWLKSQCLGVGVDDFGAAATPISTAYPGAIRPLLIRKRCNGPEKLYVKVPSTQLPRFAGRTVTCEVPIFQRIQGSVDTWNWFIADNSSTATVVGTGVSVGGYEFKTVTKTLPMNLTSLEFGFNPPGVIGDLFDMAPSSCHFGTHAVPEDEIAENPDPLIRANGHINFPLFTPFTITFPTVQMCPLCSGLFGYNDIDLEAVSLGAYHPSFGAINAKMEWTTSTLDAIVFMCSSVQTTPLNGLSFGIQETTQVVSPNPLMASSPITRCPIYKDGTFAIYTNVMGLTPIGGTVDSTDAFNSAPTSIQ
jgi:hypothetical protein